MLTPDITPAQLGAVLTFVVTQAVALTAISNDTGQLVLQVGGIVIPAAWKIADSIIRNGRAHAAAAVGRAAK